MGEATYKVVIASPAKNRYHQHVLPYLFDNFSVERALEIDEKIIATASTLDRNPLRGRKEDHLRSLKEEFRFILHKETKHFEVKIIYYIDEPQSVVYVTDFFPTKMNPRRITENF